MPSRYTFTEYSPEWPYEFDLEVARLSLLLGEEIIRVHHIGSTSIPGLAAKPIIDLLPEVRNIERIDDCAPQLVDAGYRAWGECGIPGRRYFTKDRGEYRTYNVHMFQVDDPQIERHLAFCAYLRSHKKIRDEYAAMKREVYARHPADIDAYNDGKDQWIKCIERMALEWYRQRSLPGDQVK